MDLLFPSPPHSRAAQSPVAPPSTYTYIHRVSTLQFGMEGGTSGFPFFNCCRDRCRIVGTVVRTAVGTVVNHVGTVGTIVVKCENIPLVLTVPTIPTRFITVPATVPTVPTRKIQFA